MTKKNILIVVSISLVIGLIIVIFLSLQLSSDREPALKSPSAISLSVKTNTEKPSIYGLDLPFNEKMVIHVYGKENVEKGKPSTAIPEKHIKSYELEQAELATGVQSEPAPSTTVQETVMPSGAQGQGQAAVRGPESGPGQVKDLRPTEEQIRDLQKKGIVIF